MYTRVPGMAGTHDTKGLESRVASQNPVAIFGFWQLLDEQNEEGQRRGEEGL